jgi:glycosyltransferase involved in cell wall biosynthesis
MTKSTSISHKGIVSEMKPQPLVSVVLCTYNGAAYLSEQLESILAQTYKNLEIIVLDDGSVDATLEIIKKFQVKDERINLQVNKTNLGYNKNFEKALRLSKADYLAIADQDDTWHTEKIEKLMQLWTDPSTLLVACSSATFVTGKKPNIARLKLKESFTGNDARCLFLSNHLSGHNMILKKELLNWAVPFPEKLFYDWWLAVAACANGNIKTSDEILVYQRLHSANASAVSTGVFHYQTALERIPVLINVPNLSFKHKAFGLSLIKKISKLQSVRFSFDLFWFILVHARVIFFYKRKAFPYFSYVKHAFKLASASTKVF